MPLKRKITDLNRATKSQAKGKLEKNTKKNQASVSADDLQDLYLVEQFLELFTNAELEDDLVSKVTRELKLHAVQLTEGTPPLTWLSEHIAILQSYPGLTKILFKQALTDEAPDAVATAPAPWQNLNIESVSSLDQEPTSPPNEWAQRLDDLQAEYQEEIESNRQAKEIIDVFLSVWKDLQEAASQPVNNEMEKVKRLRKITSNFLASIVHLNSTLRGAIMEFVADFCTIFFNDLQFISPESFVHVEPQYHHLKQKGGTRVNKGLSFLVIRTSTRQAIFKADITTH